MAAVALSPGVINTEMLQSCFGNSASLYQTPEAWYVSSLLSSSFLVLGDSKSLFLNCTVYCLLFTVTGLQGQLQ